MVAVAADRTVAAAVQGAHMLAAEKQSAEAAAATVALVGSPEVHSWEKKEEEEPVVVDRTAVVVVVVVVEYDTVLVAAAAAVKDTVLPAVDRMTKTWKNRPFSRGRPNPRKKQVRFSVSPSRFAPQPPYQPMSQSVSQPTEPNQYNLSMTTKRTSRYCFNKKERRGERTHNHKNHHHHNKRGCH